MTLRRGAMVLLVLVVLVLTLNLGARTISVEGDICGSAGPVALRGTTPDGGESPTLPANFDDRCRSLAVNHVKDSAPALLGASSVLLVFVLLGQRSRSA